MARAKSQGKRISRSPISLDKQKRIHDLHMNQVSIKQISKQLGISYGSAWNYINKEKERTKYY